MDNRKKVIFDCDNTMGLGNKDVDDGLALLYMLGRKDVELAGVTTTYGNSCIEDVYENTKAMFKELSIKNIPVIKGAASEKNRISDAAVFLSSMAAEEPGEIILLATGSLSNLYGAYLLDKNFFKNIHQVVLMGGITEPLVINGINLNELNFSCDPEACHKVLNSNCDVTVLTGNTCLQAYFEKYELDKLKNGRDNRIYNYIAENIEPWYEYNEKTFGLYGFYNWDIVAAVYITNPELFQCRYEYTSSTVYDLSNGYLITPGKGNFHKINIPGKIKDIDKFKQIIFEAWLNVV